MIYLLSPTAKEGTIHLPMICFFLIEEKLDFTDYDLLMFTSKQAVVSAEALNTDWKKIPCLTIGDATAKQIEKLGGSVAYLPESFYGTTLSQDIISKFREKKILYLRPKEVSFDSKAFLNKEGITLDEKIIYETQCIEYLVKDKPQKDAIIIFTSPSTIDCFFENFSWDESYKAVVIGKTTQLHLAKNIEVYIADKPLITSCIEKAFSLI